MLNDKRATIYSCTSLKFSRLIKLLKYYAPNNLLTLSTALFNLRCLIHIGVRAERLLAFTNCWSVMALASL